MSAGPCWFGDRLVERAEAPIAGDDSAFAEGRGCYTSVRIEKGRPRFEARHLRRLARGADALSLGRFDPERARRALRELAAASLPEGEGAVRLQLSRDRRGLRLTGVARGLGEDPPRWSAITAPQRHEPPPVPGGHKLTSRLVLALAAESARAAGADEALLFDGEGRLVEASRSNVLWVDEEDRLLSPPLARGAVAGVALEVLRERVPIHFRDARMPALRTARALFAVNAVRGARPIVRLDGVPVGDASHPWAARLADALARD
ncbi:MAG TPA: aminotransferase class IV [Myxococcota bacterium]|nr:aminotransferase class IV [Myxococcota bacterium]